MNKIEKNELFDVESMRQRVSDVHSQATETGEATPHDEAEGQINPFARQVAEQFRDGSRSPSMVIGQLRLFEFVSLAAIGLAVFYLHASEASVAVPALLALCSAAFAILILQAADTYLIPSLRMPLRIGHRILLSWAASFAVTVFFVWLTATGDNGQQLFMSATWFVAGAVFLLAERMLFAYGMRHWTRNGIMERRAVIVGGGQPAKDLIRVLEQQPENDIRICGIFDDRNESRSPAVVAGYPKLGTVAELVEFARLTRIDMLIISLPLSAEARILQLLKKLWVLPVDIRIAAHANKLRFRPRAYSHVGSVPMLDIFHKPIRDWDSVAKRAFDIFFSLVALSLLWPVMIGTAIAVKATSKGPIFFTQSRHGFNNEIIRVFKFRSMYTHMSDHTARNAVTKNDPRVTPVGRFIRKSSIDELPQLFNVLLGDLSLVGPRPHAVLAQTRDRAYGDIVEGYFARHRVKPGVTGWAQINGWRGEIDNDEKIKFRTAHDLYYIENWSLFFDLKILFLTPFRLLNTENAY